MTSILRLMMIAAALAAALIPASAANPTNTMMVGGREGGGWARMTKRWDGGGHGPHEAVCQAERTHIWSRAVARYAVQWRPAQFTGRSTTVVVLLRVTILQQHADTF